MTKQEKINWLENANTDELLNQVFSTVRKIYSRDFMENVEGNEDWALVTAELKKRLDK